MEALSKWIKYDFTDLSARPTRYGKHLVCRKDGKIHWETWTGFGFAYNDNVITHWAEIVPPKQQADGGKSTIDITRDQAIHLIKDEMFKNFLLDNSNDELEKHLESMGFGDDSKLRYYGYNFNVID